MALGIYKSGQGYWVRVLSAVGFGIITLATAAWVWGEADLIPLPTKAWAVSLDEVEGVPTPGQTVTVLRLGADGSEDIAAGTMVVESYEASEFNPVVYLAEPELASGFVLADLTGLEGEGFRALPGGSVNPIPVIEQLYVQGGLAGLVMLLGAGLILYFVGMKPSTCEFLIATDGEMKKVNWSTRREVMGSTWVVIAASFIIAAILYVVDLGFQYFFVAIDVLQR
jgi:preprotein translocase SecE subunit